MPELAIFGFTESPAWGDTRNPWDPSRTPAGSSGGSGVATAAGMCAIAHATDGAGSIRYPAANCGLFGLKPQRNRISLWPDRQHWYGLSVSGCVSRTVMDTALYLDAMSGPRGATSTRRPLRASAGRGRTDAAGQAPHRLHDQDDPPRPKAPEVLAAYEETVELLRSLGHEVTEASPSYGRMYTDFYPLYFRGIRDEALTLPHPERLSDQTKGFVRLGRLFSDRRLAKVRDRMAAGAARIRELFRDYDALITPATAQLPVEIGHWRGQGALRTINGMAQRLSLRGDLELHRPAGGDHPGRVQRGWPAALGDAGRPSE